jgi:nucleotide-binding universal stress UspA family protein
MSEVEPLFARPLLPVASDADAERTLAAAFPHVAAAGGRATVLHVIEKAGGAPDKAPLEQREELAEEIFVDVREAAAAAGVDVETELHYGTDVGETILDVARESDATAIVFSPRGGRSWWDLFSGDVRKTLVTESDVPVVALPERDDAAASDGSADHPIGDDSTDDDSTDDSDATDGADESSGGDAV